jgi:hypothetical protein
MRRCTVGVEERADRLRGVVGVIELDERAGLGEREPIVLGKIDRELREHRGGRLAVRELAGGIDRGEPELEIGGHAEQPADVLGEREDLRATDRLHRRAAYRDVGAAQRLAKRRGHHALGGGLAIRIGCRRRGDPARGAHEIALAHLARHHRSERELDVGDLRGRRPGLAAVASEQPAQVHEVVVGAQVERRRRERRGVGDDLLHCAIEIGVPGRRDLVLDDLAGAVHREVGRRGERHLVERMRRRQAQPAILEELGPVRLQLVANLREVWRAAHARIDDRGWRQLRRRRMQRRRLAARRARADHGEQNREAAHRPFI